MTFDADALRQQIPYYLTSDPSRKEFLNGLRALSEGAAKGYFLPRAIDQFTGEMLQGDGCEGLQIFSFSSGNRLSTPGIVLSNSCDVSSENQRVFAPKVTFAPIIKLSRVISRFHERGLHDEQIASRLAAIRSQSITNIFYLPADGPLSEEHVALFDDLHSMPVEVYRSKGVKLFTLSMIGFYLFVFKLSVHFCRLQENLDRTAPSAPAE